MQHGEVCKEARVAVEDDRMLTFELEAAEALAEMARCSSVSGKLERRSSQQIVTEAVVVSSHPSQDQVIGVQQFCGNTSTNIAGPLNTVNTTVNQTCSTSSQSKVASTLRQNLTEDQVIGVQQFCGNTSTNIAGSVNTVKTVNTTVNQICCTSSQSKVASNLRQNLTEDQAIGVQQFCGNTSTIVAGPVNPVNTTAKQTCSTSSQSKVASTLRENLTEVEKEARKLRHVLANGESTGQTICRRQDQAIGVQQFCGNTSTNIAGPLNTVNTTVDQTCRTSSRSKVASILRQNLTEVEKEAQKLRRVLANRESARQTIRRRQTMHLELTGKAADLLEENTYLKKEKELALKKYNSLKDKNEFLKAQMTKRKEAEPAEIQEEPKSSLAEISSSATATTPGFFCNQPSLVPFFWPSVVPSSNIFNLQCASHSDVTSASQFHMPIWDNHCSNQGQKCSTGITKPGTPLFVLSYPWLLPFLTPTSTLESCSGISDRQNKTSLIHQCHMCSSSVTQVHQDNHKLSSNQNTTAEASNSSRTISMRPHPKAAEHNVNPVSSLPEHTTHAFLKKKREPFIPPSIKPEDVIAATEARRKRKELMKLKNIHCHNAHPH